MEIGLFSGRINQLASVFMQMPPFDYFALSLIYGQWPKGEPFFPIPNPNRIPIPAFRAYCARHV